MSTPDEVRAERDRPAASGPDHGLPPQPSTAAATVLLGALMVVGSVLVLVDAMQLPETSDAVGPGAVPSVAGVLLGVVGLLLVLRNVTEVARTRRGDLVGSPRRLLAVGVMLVLLVAFAFALPHVGYVVSSALLFAAAALLLDGPRSPRVVAIGWVLSVVLFFVFDRLIGVSLPTGPWGF